MEKILLIYYDYDGQLQYELLDKKKDEMLIFFIHRWEESPENKGSNIIQIYTVSASHERIGTMGNTSKLISKFF